MCRLRPAQHAGAGCDKRLKLEAEKFSRKQAIQGEAMNGALQVKAFITFVLHLFSPMPGRIGEY
jgi:hypothetical protein